jgi:hypothetical protein
VHLVRQPSALVTVRLSTTRAAHQWSSRSTRR